MKFKEDRRRFANATFSEIEFVLSSHQDRRGSPDKDGREKEGRVSDLFAASVFVFKLKVELRSASGAVSPP